MDAAMVANGVDIALYNKDPKAEITRVIKTKYANHESFDKVEAFLSDVTIELSKRLKDTSPQKDIPDTSSPLKLYKEGNKLFTMTTDLILKEGDILLVSGPSGSGKSTLGSSIATGAFVADGEIKRTPSFYESLSRDNTIPNYTLLQNILRKKEFSEDEEKQVISLFRELEVIPGGDEIAIKRKLTPTTPALSDGQKSKISLISALMSNKDLIMLDEPFANLDNDSVQKAISVIKRYANNGKSFIIIDHIQQDEQQRHLNNGTQLYSKTMSIKDKICTVQNEYPEKSIEHKVYTPTRQASPDQNIPNDTKER